MKPYSLVMGSLLVLALAVIAWGKGTVFSIRDVDIELCQEKVLRIVAEKMGVELDPAIDRPRVVVDMPAEEFNAELYKMGVLTTLRPCSHHTYPIYFPRINVIHLTPNSDLSTLAHEYVHYLQVKYPKANMRGDGATPDWMEEQARKIQYWFWDTYVKKGNRP